MNEKMTVDELQEWFKGKIVGGFSHLDSNILKEEVEKLKPGEIYLEVGVDEGKSLTVARYYAHPEVWTIGVDFIDSPNRGPYMNIPLGWNPQGQSLVKHGSKLIYVHADANEFAKVFDREISLLFIDGDHSYEGVKMDHNSWFPKVKKGGVVLYHDYDHPDVKRFIDETYGDKKEVCHGKIVRIRKENKYERYEQIDAVKKIQFTSEGRIS